MATQAKTRRGDEFLVLDAAGTELAALPKGNEPMSINPDSFSRMALGLAQTRAMNSKSGTELSVVRRSIVGPTVTLWRVVRDAHGATTIPVSEED